MPVQDNDQRIRLVKTCFVIYNHVDLPRARQFLLDFGMTIVHEDPDKEIFFTGYGAEPIIYIAREAAPGSSSTFGGAAYEVETRAELLRAASIVPNATPITPLPVNAGGGEIVSLTDPAGFQVHLVHGQTPKLPSASPDPRLEKLVVNFEDEKPRKGKFQRFTPGPAPVHKWGHYGVTYPPGTYQAMYDWYTTHLSLAPSDIVYKNGKPVTCFFHIDRGLEYTDHHAFFFKCAKSGDAPTVAHAAFEVHDFDIQQLGHQFLESRGYELCWGVGRVSFLLSTHSASSFYLSSHVSDLLTSCIACPRQSGIRLLV